jgi:hypothetical protein
MSTQMAWAVSNIYLTETEGHAEMKRAPLEGDLQNNVLSMRGEWRNSNDGH